MANNYRVCKTAEGITVQHYTTPAHIGIEYITDNGMAGWVSHISDKTVQLMFSSFITADDYEDIYRRAKDNEDIDIIARDYRAWNNPEKFAEFCSMLTVWLLCGGYGHQFRDTMNEVSTYEIKLSGPVCVGIHPHSNARERARARRGW